jgi:hypothetical protein
MGSRGYSEASALFQNARLRRPDEMGPGGVWIGANPIEASTQLLMSLARNAAILRAATLYRPHPPRAGGKTAERETAF